jgi:hypothetical protein
MTLTPIFSVLFYSDLKKDSFSKFDSTCASLEVLFGRWKNDIDELSKEDLTSELIYPPKLIQADEEDRRQQREIDREGFKRRCAQVSIKYFKSNGFTKY